MKMVPLGWLTIVLLAATPVIAAEQPPRDEQRLEPRRAMPHPPKSPLRFVQVKGNERQSLEVTYIDPRTIAFRITKSGACNRHEQGRATVAKNWWLGAETDENEAGEAIAVQEYVYRKSGTCSINLRIDEGDYTQATIREASECSPECGVSEEAMYLQKRQSHLIPWSISLR
ncbi:hypothetical protein KP003_03135 [Geomonas nitrogeniifigens]|uniref:hypothetical protein n=1 Tax=Geomonas diazotrophica TaxID=2843197 RepID=UPI001C2BEF65|nr:hypothetical protein [Geomonas nitrogeniifigens]QXE87416.1 hypothetical protein KP003_03135 [Geomonas nitrogeniifigens]